MSDIQHTVLVRWRRRETVTTYGDIGIHAAAKRAALQVCYGMVFEQPERMQCVVGRSDTDVTWPVEIEVNTVANVVGPLRTD